MDGCTDDGRRGPHKLPGWLVPTKHTVQVPNAPVHFLSPRGMCSGRPLFHIGDMLRDALKAVRPSYYLQQDTVCLLLSPQGLFVSSMASMLGSRPVPDLQTTDEPVNRFVGLGPAMSSTLR